MPTPSRTVDATRPAKPADEAVALFDFDAERRVLGAALIDPDAFEEIASKLTVDDFFFIAHRQVFGAMLGVRARGQIVSVATVHAELGRRGLLKVTRRQPWRQA